MGREASDFFPEDEFSEVTGSGQVGVQELTWSLLDDVITDGEFQLLETILLADDAARSEYLGCIQLHVDLMAHFAPPPAAAASGKSPILGFLGGGVPPMDVPTSH
jgi:hypothetical protein